MVRFVSQAASVAWMYAVGYFAQTTTSSTSTRSAASSCPTVLDPRYGRPVVGSGWTAQVIANGLTRPRGIMFDQAGALLIVNQASGIVYMTFNDYGGTCLTVNSSKTLIDNDDLNHSLEMSSDGRTLYASTSDSVYAWQYDAAGGTVNGENVTLITNMSNTDHVSRTLLLSRKANDTLLVSRGSSENMDFEAQQISSGHSQIKAFNLSSVPADRPYDYPSEGLLLGWGLRNSVGVAEHPVTGGIYSVENSADQIQRDGTDIHEDDPGEEMNFHGFLNGSTDYHGANYGYPDCFALWGTDIPSVGSLQVGDQFALNPDTTLNDTTCAESYIAPRLTFQAHTAPLDIKFTPDGGTAYVSFHGSWNRDDPVGYSLASVSFADGEPVDPPTSTTAAVEILSNGDLTECPGSCFRPVGIALDGQGRVFMSSDATGEIYVLQRGEMTATGGGDGSSSSSASGTLVTSSTPTTSPNVAPRSTRSRIGAAALVWTFLAVALSIVGGAFLVAA